MSEVVDINTQVFLVSTIIVPIIFAILFFWGVKDGQFRGDTESIKYKPLEEDMEVEEDSNDSCA